MITDLFLSYLQKKVIYRISKKVIYRINQFYLEEIIIFILVYLSIFFLKKNYKITLVSNLTDVFYTVVQPVLV